MPLSKSKLYKLPIRMIAKPDLIICDCKIKFRLLHLSINLTPTTALSTILSLHLYIILNPEQPDLA